MFLVSLLSGKLQEHITCCQIPSANWDWLTWGRTKQNERIGPWQHWKGEGQEEWHNHTTIRWQKASETFDWTPPCQLDHGTECHLQSFLKHPQGGWLHHLPGQRHLVPNHSLCEEIPPNAQPKLPLRQLETVFSFCCLLPGKTAQPLPSYNLLSESYREQ